MQTLSAIDKISNTTLYSVILTIDQKHRFTCAMKAQISQHKYCLLLQLFSLSCTEIQQGFHGPRGLDHALLSVTKEGEVYQETKPAKDHASAD